MVVRDSKTSVWDRLARGLPALILVAGLLATFLYDESARQSSHEALTREFQIRADDIFERITERLRAYERVLRGAAGLFASGDAVGRDEWRKYAVALDLQRTLPGIQALGFAAAVEPGDVASLTARLRKDGFPDFAIRPEGERELYAPVTLIEPFTGRNLRVFGFDMMSESTRRAAILAARDQGDITLTAKLTLIQENHADAQPGFLLCLPIFKPNALHDRVADRRQAILGWVYGAFRMTDFMSDVTGRGLTLNGIRFDVIVADGDAVTPERVMFHYDGDDDPVIASTRKPLLMFKRTLSFGGHAWTVVVHSPKTFDTGYFDGQARVIVASGVVISLLLASLVWLVIPGKATKSPGRARDLGAGVVAGGSGRWWAGRAAPYALAAALSLAAGLFALKADESEWRARGRAERIAVENQLEMIGLRLERALTVPMNRIRGMEAQIVAHGDVSPAEFLAVAQVVTRGHPAIRNIGVSHGTVLDRIYPLAGNEAALGVDYRAVESQWSAVRRAIETRVPVIQGPIPLLQGGSGLILRHPVFLPDPAGGDVRLFGLVSIVLDIPSIYAEAGLDRASPPISLAIRGRDGMGEKGDLIDGDASILSRQPVEVDVQFPYGSWRLSAIPRAGWGGGEASPPLSRLVGGGFLLFVMLISFGTARHLNERRGFHERLTASEERFRLLLQIASDGIHILDMDGNLILSSQSFRRMLGYDDHEAATLNLRDWDAVLAPEELVRRIRALVVSPGVFETRHRRRDGAILDVEINARGVEIDGVSYLYASSRDITERKGHEVLIRRQSEIIRQSPAAIIVTGMDGVVTGWNAGAERLYGHTEAQALGRDIIFLIPEADRGDFREHVMGPLLAAGQMSLEMAALCRSGETVPVDLSLWMLRDDHGTPTALIGYSVDIGARKQAEMALLDSEERLKLALSAATMGVWEWRMPTGEIYWTPECLPIMGVNASAGTLEDFTRLVHPDDLDWMMTAARTAVDTGAVYSAEFRIIRPDGEVRWLANRGKSDRGKDGVPMRMVGTVQDITARREYEDEIKRARLAAEEGARAKADFLAMMSHEIRTPITSVLGMADLLRDTPLTAEQSSHLDTLGSATKTLLTILNDILDISKLDAGKVMIEAIPFRPREVLRDVVDLGRGGASAKGITLDWVIRDDVPDAVIGDPTRVKQVLFNLIGNAIKFTGEGAVRLRVSVRRREENTVEVLTEVEDTGIGLDRERIATLFQPFAQADQTTTRRFGGTGLGLAIARRLVERMGGAIGVDSEPGQGATFWFTLPFQVAADHPAPVAVPAAPRPPVRPLRILLAEDNRINQMLVRSMLTKLGHTVTVVDNGRLALEAVAAGDFDLALMDMQMPEMDGEDATRAIRALPPPRNRLPVIALTADVMTEHRERYLGAGVDALVGKPIDWDVLSEALAAHADRR